MSASVLDAALATEPTTLAALEAALGVSLGRDPGTEDAWLVRRTDPAPGLAFVMACFLGEPGDDLGATADPTIVQLRLRDAGGDCRADATRLLGPGEARGGEVSFDRYHGSGELRAPTYTAWTRARGTLSIYDHDPAWAFWHLTEPPPPTIRSATETTALIGQIAALAASPLVRGSIERVVGPLAMDGRYPERVARGATWCLRVRPIDADAPRELALELTPALPAEPLAAALGWDDAVVRTIDVHMTSLRLMRRGEPSGANAEHRLDLIVEAPSGASLRPSTHGFPGSRAYEIDGALVVGIRVTPAPTDPPSR